MNFFNIENARAKTAEMRDPKPAPVLDDKSQAIINAVNAGDWGCQDRSVRQLVTALTGIDIPNNPGKPSPFVKGALVVTHGETLLIRGIDSDGDARIMTRDGKDIFNNDKDSFLVASENNWRVATDEEIDDFFGVALV